MTNEHVKKINDLYKEAVWLQQQAYAIQQGGKQAQEQPTTEREKKLSAALDLAEMSLRGVATILYDGLTAFEND